MKLLSVATIRCKNLSLANTIMRTVFTQDLFLRQQRIGAQWAPNLLLPLAALFIVPLLFVASGSSAESDVKPRTGYFKVEFTPLELLGEQGVIDAADILRSEDNISWQLYVPDSYDAAHPAGVMVYVSPTPKGGPPRMDDKNLIWIGANDAGNRVAVGKRMLLAMLAPKILARDYALDPDRIYVAGFSGGGKTASRVAVARPEVFRGGIYIAGAEAWG